MTSLVPGMHPIRASDTISPFSPAATDALDHVSLAADRQRPPANITSLPNEIHHLIASNLCEHCTGCLANPDQPSHTNSAELSNLCLVDTHWRDIATPYLYHFCVLRQKALLLVYALFERPDLAKHIKSFSFREVHPGSMEIPQFRRPRSLETFRNHASLGTHALKPLVDIGTRLWGKHFFRGTALWHQWLMLQTPVLETVLVYHQHRPYLHETLDTERLTFMESQRNRALIQCSYSTVLHTSPVKFTPAPDPTDGLSTMVEACVTLQLIVCSHAATAWMEFSMSTTTIWNGDRAAS